MVGLRDNAPQAIGPRDVIGADGRYGLAAGLAFGLAVGFFLGLVAGIEFGLAVGLTWAAGAWTRFHISVVIAGVQGSGPVRYGAFLTGPSKPGCCAPLASPTSSVTGW